MVSAAIRSLNSSHSRAILTKSILDTSKNINLTNQRGAKNVIFKTIRTKLPKYKKNLARLPPLTDLLTRLDYTVDLKKIMNTRCEKLEVYKQYIPVGANTNYLEAIFHVDTNDSDRILEIIELNLETLNSFYLAVTFEALDDLMFAELCEPLDFAQSRVFKELCTKTLYKIRFFESDEVLKLLKCISRIGIAEDTLIVQAALQMARHHINDYNIKELDMLMLTLTRFKEIIEPSKSLLVALKVAIPKAKDRQFKEKLIDEEQLKKIQVK